MENSKLVLAVVDQMRVEELRAVVGVDAEYGPFSAAF
jgi:hypothetical protein